MNLFPAFGWSASRGSGACKAARGTRQEAKAARCPKARPPGLEGTKARDETIGLWELEDERGLAKIACLRLREATARKV